ncbi:hypothetical protein ACRXCV_04975 [Halobacteriovorax sp. GFR7]|uniref:hypothetical protein n=1 Tax=unclassified Halobacteriovorax TaxID=2639665 RepID=UPI003D953095
MKNKRLINLLVLFPLLVAFYVGFQSYENSIGQGSLAERWTFSVLEGALFFILGVIIEIIVVGIIINIVKIIRPSIQKSIDDYLAKNPILEKVILNSRMAELGGALVLFNLFLYKNVNLELGYELGIVHPLLTAMLVAVVFIAVIKVINFGASLFSKN